MKDQLYLLQPGFMNNGQGPFYCGDSVAVRGLLGFFPELGEAVDVHYIAFVKPRTAIVELLGEENQSAPVLVLAEGVKPKDAAIEVQHANGRAFIANEAMIRRYLSSQFDQPTAS